MKERDLCVRKNFRGSRDKRRIDVICNKMLELWENLKPYNPSIGFFGLTSIILEYANKKFQDPNCIDPFYWEEDKWYDELDLMIVEAKDLDKDIASDNSLDVEDMKKTMGHFKSYWYLFNDFRLYQVLDKFDNSFKQRVKESEIFDGAFWKRFFGVEIIDSLVGSLESVQRAKINLPDNTFNDLYKELEIVTKQKLEEARKEYL